MKLPIVFQGQVVDRPVALASVIFEGVANDLRAMFGGNGQRPVRAAGIDHMDIVGDQGSTCQRRTQGGLGIEGQDDDGKGHEARVWSLVQRCRLAAGARMVAEAGRQV